MYTVEDYTVELEDDEYMKIEYCDPNFYANFFDCKVKKTNNWGNQFQVLKRKVICILLHATIWHVLYIYFRPV